LALMNSLDQLCRKVHESCLAAVRILLGLI
jgi:hypothetical protein